MSRCVLRMNFTYCLNVKIKKIKKYFKMKKTTVFNQSVLFLRPLLRFYVAS